MLVCITGIVGMLGPDTRNQPSSSNRCNISSSITPHISPAGWIIVSSGQENKASRARQIVDGGHSLETSLLAELFIVHRAPLSRILHPRLYLIVYFLDLIGKYLTIGTVLGTIAL